ncbi:MAG: imidazole glycerol phosphate synthase subunit HisH [Myxococcales bacterium]|nr:imidazole glycerol phosphate synthase subunit HisH [Myxococcales bacterium]
MPSSPPTIAVVDYGYGNLRSVAKALERCALSVRVTGDPAELARADGVVLPGVGAFKDAAENLAKRGLDEAVVRAIEAGKPYLGLCLGLQLLFEEGHEHGVTKGFGLLPGRVERFPDTDPRLCVPHIGWNEVVFSGSHPMLAALPPRDHYYFVHSYRAVPAEASDVVGRTEYGGTFASAVAREGIFAVQFHPEKSQSAGHRLLEAYAAWVAR